MLHAVLRVLVPSRKAKNPPRVPEHYFTNSSLPEDLNLYILQRFNDIQRVRYSQAEDVVPELHATDDIDPLGVIDGKVQLHEMLNWIVESGWKLTNVTSTASKVDCHMDAEYIETYLFVRHPGGTT